MKTPWISRLIGRFSGSAEKPILAATVTKERNVSAMNLLKIRELRNPLEFEIKKGADEVGDVLTLADSAPGYDKAEYSAQELRTRIEPWLTSLLQSEHLSLLVGSGLTSAVHRYVTDATPEGFGTRDYPVFNEQIKLEMERMARKTSRGEPNYEDQLRTALKLHDGLKILLTYQTNENPENWSRLFEQSEKLRSEIERTIEELVKGVLTAERRIGFVEPSASEALERQERALAMLVSFLMSFASRTGTRDRLGVFTTNYDRLIEFGAELAGIRLVDRFVGSLSPVFRSSRLDVDLHYNPPGIRGEPRYLEGVARFTKLHGSLDWVDEARQIRRVALPFGAKEYGTFVPDGVERVLIYPNDAKDRETAEYPYVELFRDLAAALCRPNSTLITYGYSFGDQHVNRIIQDMLTIPSTHLVIINFDDTGKRLSKFYRDSKRLSQISLLIGNHFGDLKTLIDYYLPKPAIDRASIRMADLMRARGYGTKPEDKGKTEGESTRPGADNSVELK